MDFLYTLIPIGIVVLFALVFLLSGYVKAPPNVAYVISGIKKHPRILVGKAGFKIPFFERLDKLALGTVQIDVKTKSPVPTAEYINVRVDSNVNVRVSEKPEMIALACQNFLNLPKDEINNKVKDLLEGNIREIVGAMKLTEMVSDRKAFSEKVQVNAVPDLARFGLELVSFNVQNFIDDNGVIENLGIDNVEQIRKKAVIAKSDAQKEIAIAEANNAKAANDARAQAEEEIAVRNNVLEIKKAELKKTADVEQAKADAAKDIEAEKQREIRDVAATNADIARRERETELKKQEIELRERELDALVRKQADADKYAAEKEAEAELVKRQRDAEARAYEIAKEAEATKLKADADRYAAEQEAAGIAAKGVAEAEAIQKKAEAQKLMGEASILEMYFDALPKAVANAAAPLTNVEKITMYGEGNQSKMVGDVMKSTDQIINALEGATGIDMKSAIAGFIGGKAAN